MRTSKICTLCDRHVRWCDCVVIAECGCGREYTDRTWADLVLVGLMNEYGCKWEPHHGDKDKIELRNCECGSTICPFEGERPMPVAK